MSDLNDPRVFFAAERTLLAWNRTSLTLMGFGFVVEKFALFVRMLMPDSQTAAATHGPSFWIGISFIVLGAATALLAILQYRRVLATLRPVEIPPGYWTQLAVYATLLLAVLGIVLAAFLATDLK